MKRPVVIVLLTVALTLVCAGIAAVAFFFWGIGGGLPTNNPFDVMNVSSQVEENKTLKVDAAKPVTLKVTDDAGDVTITGGDVKSVEVKVVKTAYDSSQARADEEVKTLKYTVEQTGNTITLKYQLPNSINIRNKVDTVDFIVTVPTETIVDVDNQSGDVTVSAINGKVTVETAFGEINADNLEGAVSLTTNSGTVTATSIKANEGDIILKSDFGALTLEKANGKDITIDTNSGTVKLDEVRATGKLSLSTQFGDVSYENGSANSVFVKTNSGSISLTKLTVAKDIHVEDEFGTLKLDQALAASYDLQTNSGDITVDGAKGELAADTQFGGIDITNAEAVTLNLKTNSGAVNFSGTLGVGAHTVKSEFGAVDLTLPADVKLNVDLTTEFGKIKSDMPIAVNVTETSGSNSSKDQLVGTINGGGDLLTVETNNGDVTIHASK
ncbi:MAG: DUF4097 family beta strand repeat-containing protein [Anaerolineales bacterium]